MKKFASIVLLLCIIISVVSCANDGISKPESDAQNASRDNNNIESNDNTKISAEMEDINQLLKGDVNRTVKRTNILKDVSYKPSREAGSDGSYTDPEHKKLTDGVFVDAFNTHSWAGYTGKQDIVIDFELPKAEKIADVEVGCFRQIDYGIGLPNYAELYVSEDGKKYTKLGKQYKAADISQTDKFTFVFRLQGVVETKYLRIKLVDPEGGFVFVDEIAAYKYDGVGSEIEYVDNYYKPFKPVNELVYWDKSEADYNQKQNLSKGKKTFAISFSPLEKSKTDQSQNSLPESGILTDGIYASNVGWDNSLLFRCSHGDGRQLLIDLEKVSAVTGVKGDALQQSDWGVRTPKAFGISVSENGIDWQGVATYEFNIDKPEITQMVKFSVDFSKTYKARYVKVQFLINPHVAISEIEVFGTKAIPAAAVSPDPKADVTRLSDRFATPEDFGGINNILCNPVCRGDGVKYDESAMITHDEFLRYVGYYEGDTLKDTFFDTFLFSPCSDFTLNAERTTFKGWKFYVDSQFVPDRNLDALNKAVGTIGKGLNKNDYKLNIFFSILRTYPTTADGKVNNFGDIDGDGKVDSFDKLENRKKATKWMIDTQLQRYKAAGLSKLELVGFYWQEEHIVHDDPLEIEILRWTADYVHSLGYKLLWIPYYQAQGFAEWKNYGIDLACLQPNYSFMSNRDDYRLDTTAYQAKMHGMCVELELSAWSNKVNIERYKQYLEYGVKYGYMNAVKVYYLGVIPTDLTQALAADDEYTRSVYRDTYLFAKGLLDENYNKPVQQELVKPEDLSIKTDGKSVKGKINIDSKDYRQLQITVSPKYGSLRLDYNGNFTYYPPKDIVGSDSFCVAAVYASGISENAVITITK